jgi:hypothetical protein
MSEYIADAVAALTATGGVVRATKSLTPIPRLALRQLRLFGTLEAGWLDIDDQKAMLTVADISDLERFLDDRETRALLSMLAITLMTPHSDLRTSSLKAVRSSFDNLTNRWRANHEGKWIDRRDPIWERVLRLYDSATPAGRELGEAAQEFTDFVTSPIARQSGQPGASARHIERLSELCADIGRVAQAIDTAAHLREAIADAPAPPIITYTTTSRPATFADLYVPRKLVPADPADEAETALDRNGPPFRVVLHGAPGAGKSTFVKNLRQDLAAAGDGQAALLVTVRTYVQSASDRSMSEHLHSTMRSNLNLEFDELSLRNGLTLGLYVVIFDGLDEVTDINLRIEMVERIASFAREYPAVSILVTSRSVGYERAPLPPSFRTLTLEQYTRTQSRNYVDRWFAFIERPELVAEFERESQTVLDLKANPLLLSLLCVLYRERGSIPRRRRDIYAQCADLLFHTWDSHRHIDQPEELHANGDRIMQEIARWVYTSQSAQNGLEESVIQKTIGIYLRDHVGVEEGDARRRAGEFLEFCANRAWLLGTMGTRHGERVFGFTHRTFFEYFTAEAFSRSGGTPSEIAQIVIQAHKRDSTSVLPELLLQAYDDKVDRGASKVFEGACALTRDELLILRLMDGVPLPNRARATGFDRIFELWAESNKVSETAFVSLLSINGDARAQFISDYLSAGSSETTELFLAAWASLDLAGSAARHEHAWGEIVDLLVRDRWNVISTSKPALRAWLWISHSAEMPVLGNQLLTVWTVSGPRVGLLWLGVEKAVQSSARANADLLDLFARGIQLAKQRQKVAVSRQDAQVFANELQIRLAAKPLISMPDTLDGPAGKWAYLYAVAVAYEVFAYDQDRFDAMWSHLSPLAQELWRARIESASFDNDGSAMRPLSPTLVELPKWLRDWATGQRAFVG